ncbi:g6331 [Coccomyxa viridis]|uniref:G6331 protein n=1 Tax=Coccomyxa viridis TaxID=1274662 RepID=A0ABP1G1Q3_9CHLO
MGRRSNYDNRGFQQQQGGGDQQGGGVFGRLSQQPQQQQQRQADTRQGGWGTGYRGNQGQQERGQNRFGAFNQEQDDRWNPNQTQGRGGQRRDKPQQAADWRAVVRDDVKTEQQQPPWPFTCYAHQRGGPNDMAGDFSYEEVRWYQMEAAKSGKPLASLMADFNASRKAQEQQFQALLRMNHPPSLSNVPPSEPPNPFTAQQNPFQPATPFGQIVGAFGANPAAMPPSPAFGSGFAPSLAQSMPTAGPFTSSSSSFGGQPQATPTPFGSQPKHAFGQPAAPQQSSFPFGQGASGTPGGASNAFGFGGSSPAGTTFGAQQQQQQPQHIGAFGSDFQKSGAAGNSSTSQEQGQADRVPAGDSDNPWLAHSFQQGKIPETPPPPEVC